MNSVRCEDTTKKKVSESEAFDHLTLIMFSKGKKVNVKPKECKKAKNDWRQGKHLIM